MGFGDKTIVVAGTKIRVPYNTNHIEIRHGKIYADGRQVAVLPPCTTEVKVDVDGHPANITVDQGNIIVHGSVEGNVSTNGSVECGNVNGYVSANGNVVCGNVQQTVRAGGNISANAIAPD
jgi:hypothetical protein